MPYPSQTTREQIIECAWQLTAEQGFEKLTLKTLADSLGIRAPSLYNHVKNKEALLQFVNALTIERMFATMYTASENTGNRPEEKILAVVMAQRRFAHEYPVQYTLAFSALQPDTPPDERRLSAVLYLQTILAEISGEERSLPAMRGLLALTHGFAMLELNNQLRRGGDLDEAFRLSVQAFLRGWR